MGDGGNIIIQHHQISIGKGTFIVENLSAPALFMRMKQFTISEHMNDKWIMDKYSNNLALNISGNEQVGLFTLPQDVLVVKIVVQTLSYISTTQN